MCYPARGHGRARAGGHDVDTAAGPEVPEPDGLVLGAGDEHGAAPGVEGEDVARVARHGLEGGDRAAVRHVHLAVPRPGRQQQRRPARALLHEAAVPHRAVVHRQVVLAALQRGRARVEAHQLHRLVVAAGGDEVAARAPGEAVDGALVVLGPLEEHGGLVGLVVPPHLGHAGVLADPQRLGVGAHGVELPTGVELRAPHRLHVLQRRHLHTVTT